MKGAEDKILSDMAGKWETHKNQAEGLSIAKTTKAAQFEQYHEQVVWHVIIGPRYWDSLFVFCKN